MGLHSRLVFGFNRRALRRVLLAATEHDARLQTLGALRDDGHDVVSVRDLTEMSFALDAIEFGLGLKPHVLVIDADFAGGAGVDALCRREPMLRATRTILVVDGHDDGSSGAGRRLAPWAVLERPFEDQDLLLAVAHARVLGSAPAVAVAVPAGDRTRRRT